MAPTKQNKQQMQNKDGCQQGLAISRNKTNECECKTNNDAHMQQQEGGYHIIYICKKS